MKVGVMSLLDSDLYTLMVRLSKESLSLAVHGRDCMYSIILKWGQLFKIARIMNCCFSYSKQMK